MGDSVLLEPLASLLQEAIDSQVTILSNYPELFIGHPTIHGIPLEMVSHEARVIPMNSIAAMKDKLARMYEEVGFSTDDVRPPQLYLTDEEIAEAKQLSEVLPQSRVGVVLKSRHQYKDYPFISRLIKSLAKKYPVFAFSETDNHANYAAFQIFNQPIRKVMMWLSLMDLVIGPDTGILHIAGALNVPTIVLTRKVWADLHEIYPRAKLLTGWTNGFYSLYTFPVRVKKVVKTAKAVMDRPQQLRVNIAKKQVVGLFRLDGLGGTITLSDQAKKIFEMTGMKSVPIVRSYAGAFEKNPYISDVVTAGYVRWDDCLAEMKERFDIIAEERFALGRWHQKNGQLFKQDFEPIRGMFERFPKDYVDLEIHKLHHIQITDRTLGLPYDTIDSKIFAYGVLPNGLPQDYIAISNGVDIQHQGMRQMKTWDYWDKLVAMLDMPVVQVGTTYDNPVVGTYDFRGKTTLPELFMVLQKARIVLCCEGGMMHLAYAVGNPNVIVLRGPTTGKLFEYPGHRFIDSFVCTMCWSRTDDWYERCSKGLNKVCMETITPHRVANYVMGVLNEDMV